MTIKVALRKKEISQGRQSLYLDFYPAIPHPKTGKPTRREFLGLYIFNKTKTPIDKRHNEETIKIAESIRQKRENFLNKPEIYSEYEKEQLRKKELAEMDFVEYFRKLANKKRTLENNSWGSVLYYLEDFTNGPLRFGDLNERILEDFKEYLLSAKSKRSDNMSISQNTALSYFNKIKAALRQAYKDGMLQIDLHSRVESIKPAETQRSFVTLEELNALVKTDCQYPLLKQAALFSALTGLRFSDIQKLVWDEIEYIEGQGYTINFRQKKTKGVEVLPISDQAFGLLGEQKGTTDQIFDGLKYSAYHNKALKQWIKDTGITKDITFHCFRHTFATLQLSQGTDIYTVSKMLGHRELKTTQIYAKVMDQAKREAANKIKLDM